MRRKLLKIAQQVAKMYCPNSTWCTLQETKKFARQRLHVTMCNFLSNFSRNDNERLQQLRNCLKAIVLCRYRRRHCLLRCSNFHQLNEKTVNNIWMIFCTDIFENTAFIDKKKSSVSLYEKPFQNVSSYLGSFTTEELLSRAKVSLKKMLAKNRVQIGRAHV